MPDWLPLSFSQASLIGLFFYSYLAATLLPGGSEVVLAALVAAAPESQWTALAIATVGNTLGGLTSWFCGRLFPVPEAISTRRTTLWLRKHGATALLLSWLPIIGDLLCLAAGWMRIGFWPSAIAIGAGKFARYWLVIEGVRYTVS